MRLENVAKQHTVGCWSTRSCETEVEESQNMQRVEEITHLEVEIPTTTRELEN